MAMVCGKLCEAPEGDYFVTCSFDKNHVLLRSRMPYHIVKCKMNHPGHNKIQCPYDATEYIDQDEFMSHIVTCDSKRSISTGKYETAVLKETGNLCDIRKTPFFHSSATESEDWCVEVESDECEDDLKYVPQKGVGRGMSLQKPAPKRGRGRSELLSRFMKLYEEKQAVSSSSSVSLRDNMSAARTEITPGQFEDDWDM